MTLDELFDGEGLDQRLAEEVEASHEGVKAEVIVAPMPTSQPPPETYHISIKIFWRQGDSIPVGEITLRWLKSEPKVLYFALLRIDFPLRQARKPGLLGGLLIRFFHDELGIEELYAVVPVDEVRSVGTICGFRDVEREDGGVWFGGRIDEGPMREHALAQAP